MGKRKNRPVLHQQEQCDVWLSTAQKKEQVGAGDQCQIELKIRLGILFKVYIWINLKKKECNLSRTPFLRLTKYKER